MSRPVSSIHFKGFGDSSIDFDMRVFIRDVDDMILVQNELRVSIFNAFKEEGIEIPFPQRDLYLKSTPEQVSPNDLDEKTYSSLDKKSASPKKA